MSYLKFSEPKAPTRVHIVTPTEWGNNDAKDYDPTALVAVMKAPDAAVTYTLDPNGGTWDDGTTTSKTVPEGDFFNPSASDPTQVTPNPPKKEGYVCIGWTSNFQTIDEFLEYVQTSAPDPSSVDKADQIVYHLVYDNNVDPDGTYYAVWAPESVLGIKGSYELVTAKHKLRFVGSITFDSQMRATYTTTADSWRINQDTILDMFVTYDPELFETPNAIEIHHLATYNVRDRPPYMKKISGCLPTYGYITNEHQDEFMYQDPIPDRECGDIGNTTYNFDGSTLAETDTEYKVTGAFNEVEFFLKYYDGNGWKWDVREATHKKTVFKFEYKGGISEWTSYSDSQINLQRDDRLRLYTKHGWLSSSVNKYGYIYYKWDVESTWTRNSRATCASGTQHGYSLTFNSDTLQAIKDGKRHVLTVIVHADWDETSTENPELSMGYNNPWDVGTSTKHTNTRNWLKRRLTSDLKLFAIPDYGSIGVDPLKRTSDGLQNASKLNGAMFATCRISRMILGKMKYLSGIMAFAWSRIITENAEEDFATAIISAPYAGYVKRGIIDRVTAVKDYNHFVTPAGNVVEPIDVTIHDTKGYIRATVQSSTGYRFTSAAVDDKILIIANDEATFQYVTTSTEFRSGSTRCYRLVETYDEEAVDSWSHLPIATVHLYFPKGYNDKNSNTYTGSNVKGSDFDNTSNSTASGTLCDVMFRTQRDSSNDVLDVRGIRMIQRIYLGGMSTLQIDALSKRLTMTSGSWFGERPNNFGITRFANDYVYGGDPDAYPSGSDRTMIFGYDGYFEFMNNFCLTLDETGNIGIPVGAIDITETKIYIEGTWYDMPDFSYSTTNTAANSEYWDCWATGSGLWDNDYNKKWIGTTDYALTGTQETYNLSDGWVETYFEFLNDVSGDHGQAATFMFEFHLRNLGTNETKTIYANAEWYEEQL